MVKPQNPTKHEIPAEGKKNVVQITCILSITKNHFELKNAINTELCKKFGQKRDGYKKVIKLILK